MVLAPLATALMAACLNTDFSVSPDTATNPAGTTHTITIDITANVEKDKIGVIDVPWTITILITAGPNLNTASPTVPCNPNPTCTGLGDSSQDWTYTSKGMAGTDTIHVCVEFATDNVDQGAEVQGQAVILGGGGGCVDVFKTWVVTPTPTRTNTPTTVSPTRTREPDDDDDDVEILRRTPTRTSTPEPTRTNTPVPSQTPSFFDQGSRAAAVVAAIGGDSGTGRPALDPSPVPAVVGQQAVGQIIPPRTGDGGLGD